MNSPNKKVKVPVKKNTQIKHLAYGLFSFMVHNTGQVEQLMAPLNWFTYCPHKGYVSARASALLLFHT